MYIFLLVSFAYLLYFLCLKFYIKYNFPLLDTHIHEQSILSKKTYNYTILIILNTEISNHRHFKNLLSNAECIICADGGANRLYDYLKKRGLENDILPKFVIGDFDSIRDNVKSFYLKKGCLIATYYDQDTTDFEKCLSFIKKNNLLQEDNICILVYGAFGDRFDHEMNNFNILCRQKDILGNQWKKDNRLILLGNKMLAFLLPIGNNIIIPNLNYSGKTCGLIPLLGKSKISTKGLKWDLYKQNLEFGNLLSTSNQINDMEINIYNDKPLIWTNTIKYKVLL